MLKLLRISISITLVMLIIVSGIYPLFITAISQLAFRNQADGSLIKDKSGQYIGSALLAQNFTGTQYFQPRPSAAGNGYDPTASGGTNLGPTSDKLINGAQGFVGVKQLAAQYRSENHLASTYSVPVDAVTRSASGLDPNISPFNAELQVPRIAQARDVSSTVIINEVKKYTAGRAFGIIGEPAVNVLLLNLDLDKKYPVKNINLVTHAA